MKSSSARIRSSSEKQIAQFYAALQRAFGQQHWWPAETPFEVVVGAYLTQNTAWTNVELAMNRLRSAGVLSSGGIQRTSIEELEQLIRPAGYFRQKARALKTFVAFMDERYQGSLEKMFREPTAKLREELLALRGVGPETADSILLYAAQHPSFVVDAYTRRILERHALAAKPAPYDEIKQMCEAGLRQVMEHEAAVAAPLPTNPLAHPPSRMSRSQRAPIVQVYNDMHGYFVSVGKQYCQKRTARCEECPLRPFLPPGGPVMQPAPTER